MLLATAKSCAAEPSSHLIVNESQPSKASSDIDVMLDGMVTVLNDVHCPKISSLINTPSITTIKYSDSIWLHAEIIDELPEDAKMIQTPSNKNFQVVEVSSDGMSCKITPVSSGITTFTVSVVDANENVLSTDTQDMTAKAGLWQKIVAFFKKLFGATKTYPEFFKRIF